ncbi:MAG TPA: hypothetical protein VIN01_05675 [Candidatus Dormibacteraeota bacterium]
MEPTLQVPGHPEVFVIGDLASFPVGKGALPQLAPVAIQGGSHGARNLRALSSGGR